MEASTSTAPKKASGQPARSGVWQPWSPQPRPPLARRRSVKVRVRQLSRALRRQGGRRLDRAARAMGFDSYWWYLWHKAGLTGPFREHLARVRQARVRAKSEELAGLSIKELKAVAKAHGVRGYSKVTLATSGGFCYDLAEHLCKSGPGDHTSPS